MNVQYRGHASVQQQGWQQAVTLTVEASAPVFTGMNPYMHEQQFAPQSRPGTTLHGVRFLNVEAGKATFELTWLVSYPRTHTQMSVHSYVLPLARQLNAAQRDAFGGTGFMSSMSNFQESVTETIRHDFRDDEIRHLRLEVAMLRKALETQRNSIRTARSSVAEVSMTLTKLSASVRRG